MSASTIADVVKQYAGTDCLPGVPLDVQLARLGTAIIAVENGNPNDREKKDVAYALKLVRQLHKMRADKSRDLMRNLWLMTLDHPHLAGQGVHGIIHECMLVTDSVWLAQRVKVADEADKAAGKPAAEKPESNGEEKLEGGAA